MLSDLNAVLAQLTDETNDQPIELINDRGEKARFSQMALIPVTTPSEEYEDEFIEHYFALLQPLDENGENVGDCVVFDFCKNESGELSVELVDDPYVMRAVMELYRQRGKHFKEEDEEPKEECDSIFGGTLTEESEPELSVNDLPENEEQNLQELLADAEKEKKKKKGFFGKLFGKK